MTTYSLINGYEVRVLSHEAFQPLFAENRPKMFGESFSFFPDEFYSDHTKDRLKKLEENMGNPWRLDLGLFYQDRFVGWSCGRQMDREKYYMGNSAVFPEHRGKGLYKNLLKIVIECATAEGFQIICSRHAATNSAVIVPKLKAGFVISGFEMSDTFGLLVHLSYFTDEIRRKVMDVRAGMARPQGELARYFRLT